MKTIRFFLLWCMVVAISACTPFYRGFEGSTLVSPARPDVSVSVVDMPMLAHGQIAPFLNTDQGYQFPETLVSAYGTDAASPVAIVALSFVPSNAWEWDPLSFSGPMAQQNMGTVFGGESFYGSVRIVNGAKDPFAPLFAPEDQWASLDWLVQRFACLNDFRRSKLILEYREPLPRVAQGRFRSAGIQRGCAGVPRTGGQGVPRPVWGGSYAQGRGPVYQDAQCPLYGELPRQHVREGTLVPQLF